MKRNERNRKGMKRMNGKKENERKYLGNIEK